MNDPVFICLLCEQPIDAEEQADMVCQDYPDGTADYLHADCADDDDLYDEDDVIYPDPNEDLDYFGPPDGWDDEEDW